MSRGRQAEMVLDELRVQHLDPKALEATGCHPEHRLSSRNLKAHITITHLLQEGYTYSKKVTPLIGATPFWGHFLSNHNKHPLSFFPF